MTSWTGTRVLVTGGASFIGSHLVDALVRRGARVRVADNLSSGDLANLDLSTVEFHEIDLLDPDAARRMSSGMEVVFHLAADHGGRGYIHLHQVECSTNLILDGTMFRAAEQAGVRKVVFASSGCVYPTELQTEPGQIVYLAEDVVGPPYHADELYGWAKLMGELTLKAYCEAGRLRGASLRYFTAYGPRCLENHAVMAMIARAYIGQDPFEVWGNGEQIRNWTHVDDIVEGTILAAEKIDDGTAVNLGTMERVRVLDAVHEILTYTGREPRLALDPSKPTGPLNRVCDNSFAERLLGWKPRIAFREGVRSTVDWYFRTKQRAEIAAHLPELLLARKKA
jgi:nucleoside-diphosphate-sugar epimerase